MVPQGQWHLCVADRANLHSLSEAVLSWPWNRFFVWTQFFGLVITILPLAAG